MKHWRQTLATYVYNHCNICNISIYFCNICNILIYFCNIHMKHLQHTPKTAETFEIYTCNMHCILVRPPPSYASGRPFATSATSRSTFYNICMKHSQRTSKTSETFEMYTCNMHSILVRSPPPSTSRHHIRSKRRGRRASMPGPDTSPCVGGSCRRHQVGWAAEQE
jgi:hypothetical protein